MRRRSRQVDFSKQKFFIEPKPIEGQKTYLHYRNPMRGFRYCKGARGKWTPAYRVTEGMKHNWYRRTGNTLPPGPKMIPPQIPAILKGTLGGGFRAEKETILERPEVHLNRWEASPRPHHHHRAIFHLDWRTIPGRSIERETIMMQYMAGASQFRSNRGHPQRTESKTLDVKGTCNGRRTFRAEITVPVRNFSQAETRFPPMHPSQNPEFWGSVIVTVRMPGFQCKREEARAPKERSRMTQTVVGMERLVLESAPRSEMTIPISELPRKKGRVKKADHARARSRPRRVVLRQPEFEKTDTKAAQIKLQRLELQKIKVAEDPKVSHIGYYGSAKRKVVQLKVATGAESVPPQ